MVRVVAWLMSPRARPGGGLGSFLAGFLTSRLPVFLFPICRVYSGLWAVRQGFSAADRVNALTSLTKGLKLWTCG